MQSQISPAEWQTRADLAAAYRLAALFGWDDLVFTHITAKVPDSPYFLINSYGELFEEITASSLVKIDIEGRQIEATPHANINPAGFVIHSCIHAAHPDAHCIFHTHSHQRSGCVCAA